MLPTTPAARKDSEDSCKCFLEKTRKQLIPTMRRGEVAWLLARRGGLSSVCLSVYSVPGRPKTPRRSTTLIDSLPLCQHTCASPYPALRGFAVGTTARPQTQHCSVETGCVSDTRSSTTLHPPLPTQTPAARFPPDASHTRSPLLLSRRGPRSQDSRAVPTSTHCAAALEM